MSRSGTIFAALCTAAVVVIVLGVRWFGPHDLYEKDQPKTMAYTADIVVNGRFALPRDVIYQPATKPPLYNWLDAAVIKTTGVWSEWTLKFPSVLGVLATGAIVYGMARRSDRSSVIVGLLAVGIWFTFGSNDRHGSVLRMSYLARPDMLLCAFVTGAWACFSVAIERPTVRAALWPAIGGWLCVTAAALTKGPAALMPVGFAFVYPLLTRWLAFPLALREGAGVEERGQTRGARAGFPHGDPSPQPPPAREGGAEGRFFNNWFFVGLPIVILGTGLWFALAYHQDPAHVRGVIWGAEVKGRIVDKSPEGFESPVYQSAMWFVTKAQPWGAIAAGMMIGAFAIPRLRPRVGGVALYLAIVLFGLSLPAGKRMDYLLPAYAPAAVLIAVVLADLARGRIVSFAAAIGFAGVLMDEIILLGVRLMSRHPAGHVDWFMLGVLALVVVGCLAIEQRRRIPLSVFTAVPLLLAVSFGHAFLTKFLEVKGRWSDDAVRFVTAVKQQVKPTDRVIVIARGKNPLATLLGRHYGSYLTPKDLAAADYVIIPEQPDLHAEVLSKPLPMNFKQLEDRELSVLGLYRHVPLDRLIALQKAAGDWTEVENPYHEAGTVYRDQ